MRRGSGMGVLLMAASIAAAALAVAPIGRAQEATRQGRPGPNDYFEALRARPEMWKAYSLRSQAEVVQYRAGKGRPTDVNYVYPSDPYPEKQDAAKVVIPADAVSLPNQLRLPIGTEDGNTYDIIWDAWWGKAFAFRQAHIGNFKAFQLCSPLNGRWLQVNAHFARSGGVDAFVGSHHGAMAVIDVRGYPKPAFPWPGLDAKSAGVLPSHDQVGLYPETWTRYFVRLVQTTGERGGQNWDRVSLWVADENHDPKLVLDGLRVSVRPGVKGDPASPRSVVNMWLEYNTSAGKKKIPGDRGPLVGYVRNVIVLKNVQDHAALLKRPVG